VSVFLVVRDVAFPLVFDLGTAVDGGEERS